MTIVSTEVSFSSVDSRRHQRGYRDAWTSTRGSRNYGRLPRNDRLLANDEQPPLGAHLVTPRRGFAHHGIYVGAGKVVHYGALVHHLRRRPVEEVSLAHFTHGYPAWVRSGECPRFDCAEVIRRARSRLGEDDYRLLSNNCEHFCEWCLYGQHRSYQVEEMLARPRQVLHAVEVLVMRVFGALSVRVA